MADPIPVQLVLADAPQVTGSAAWHFWFAYNTAISLRKPKWTKACDALQILDGQLSSQKGKLLLHPTHRRIADEPITADALSV